MTHHATFRINRSNHCRDMAVCRFFKMAPVRHVVFLKFRNCNCRSLRSVNVRYHAKFRSDRSSRCRDVAVYSIFKMAAVRHLGFVLRLFGPSTKCILVISVTVQNLKI